MVGANEAAVRHCMSKHMTVGVVMTVFNRKAETLACLRSLQRQANTETGMTIYVVDDASTDGTADAIRRQFPQVKLLRGDGQLYWNGGMRLALEKAYARGFDYYWWLNDDVELDEDALSRLMQTVDTLKATGRWPSIVVGSTRDSERGNVTYGGRTRTDRLRPMNFSLIEPGSEPIAAETMNGNCVLVPTEVALTLGNLTPAYRQSMGDYDYGLRARQSGYGVWVAPGTFGLCNKHTVRDTRNTPLSSELRRLASTKELPFRAWATFTRRWSGALWPVYFLSPYVRRGLGLVGERLRKSGT